MDISDIFGIRLSQAEVFELIVKHLEGLGYSVRSQDINIVPYTNSKVEFIIRSFVKK